MLAGAGATYATTVGFGENHVGTEYRNGIQVSDDQVIKPLGDRLIVEVLEEEETTVSGIVLPDTAKEKPQRGRVLAVGPGARDEDGNHIAMDLEEGDEIIFSKYGGTEIKVGVDEVLILRESDVLAKVVGDRAAV